MTTGTSSFVSVILNDAFIGDLIAGLAGLCTCVATGVCGIISVKTQFSYHVKARLISQLINVMCKILQQLLNCFNGTTISTSLFFSYHHLYHHHHHHHHHQYLVFFICNTDFVFK